MSPTAVSGWVQEPFHQRAAKPQILDNVYVNISHKIIEQICVHSFTRDVGFVKNMTPPVFERLRHTLITLVKERNFVDGRRMTSQEVAKKKLSNF